MLFSSIRKLQIWDCQCSLNSATLCICAIRLSLITYWHLSFFPPIYVSFRENGIGNKSKPCRELGCCTCCPCYINNVVLKEDLGVFIVILCKLNKALFIPKKKCPQSLIGPSLTFSVWAIQRATRHPVVIRNNAGMLKAIESSKVLIPILGFTKLRWN